MNDNQPRDPAGKFGEKTGSDPEIGLPENTVTCKITVYGESMGAVCSGCGWQYQGADVEAAAEAHRADPGFDEIRVTPKADSTIQEYFKDGVLWRADGPAIREARQPPGDGRWMFGGQLHRRGGPAESNSSFSDNDQWWVHGEPVRVSPLDEAYLEGEIQTTLGQDYFREQNLTSEEREVLAERMMKVATRVLLNERTKHL